MTYKRRLAKTVLRGRTTTSRLVTLLAISLLPLLYSSVGAQTVSVISTGLEGVAGMDFADGVFWVAVDPITTPSRIYRYDPATGGLIDFVPSPVVRHTRDVVVVGEDLFQPDDEPSNHSIHRFRKSDGASLEQFPHPGTFPDGITTDGVFLYVAEIEVGGGIQKRLLSSPSYPIMAIFPNPAPGAHGLMFLDGHLYLASNPSQVFKIDATTGDLVEVLELPPTLASKTFTDMAFDGSHFWFLFNDDQTIVRAPAGFGGLPAQGPCAIPPENLISWWPAEGDATDLLGANPGTLQNGAGFDTGLVGQAFALDGLNDHVAVSDSPGSRLDAINELTIDFWVNPASFPTAVANRSFTALMSKWGPGGHADDSWQMIFFGNHPFLPNGTLLFGVAGDTPSGNSSVTTTGQLPLSQWSHIAAVFKRGEFMGVYINGVLDVSAVPNNFRVHDSAREITIGRIHEDSGALGDSHFFHGRLDEIELLDRALAASEVQALFEAGSGGKCRGVPPIASCSDVIALVDAMCQAQASIDNGSFDPDGDAITLDQDPPGPYPLGTTTVQLTVTDEEGASSTCSATVTVVDEAAPVAECNSREVTEEELPLAITATGSDNCGVASVEITSAACADDEDSDDCEFSVEDATITVIEAEEAEDGEESVTWQVTVTDDSGNVIVQKCSLTVVDDEDDTEDDDDSD